MHPDNVSVRLECKNPCGNYNQPSMVASVGVLTMAHQRGLPTIGIPLTSGKVAASCADPAFRSSCSQEGIFADADGCGTSYVSLPGALSCSVYNTDITWCVSQLIWELQSKYYEEGQQEGLLAA